MTRQGAGRYGRLEDEFVPPSDQVRLEFDEAYAKPLKTYGKGRK